MKSGGNTNTKLILVHPYIQKQTSSNRLWLLAFVSLFTIAFLLTLLYTTDTIISSKTSSAVSSVVNSAVSSTPTSQLPPSAVNALLHYASRSNDSFHMSHGEMKSISDVLRRCAPPCNLLVFGLTHETLLWKSLNHNGRTVYIEENRYYAAYFEEIHPEIEVFDVQYTTKAREARELVSAVKEAARNECRPVQNLLFSDCKLGLNDLPNHVYDLDWDVILVDGPRGDGGDVPGRMSSIFTAAVLARSKRSGGNPKTHVFVHDYYRDIERLCGDEFLCRENLVESNDMLAHYVLERMDKNSTQFCRGRKKRSASPSP
ncbi:Protein IRX15-LIKE [Hirschfeldia incana]|nr:Protein IRX15-LIKE [Hirschfeldia incana]